MHTLPEHFEYYSTHQQRKMYYGAFDWLTALLSGQAAQSKSFLDIEGCINRMARTAKDIKKAMQNDNQQINTTSKKPAKWILADVRSIQHQAAIPEYAADVQRVLDHMVELCEAGCNISITRDRRDKPVCYVFYPDVGEPHIAATSSNAPDGYLALAVAMYKDEFILAGKPYANEHASDQFNFS